MRLHYLAFRNMISKPLNLLLSLMLLLLSVSLVTFVLQFSQQFKNQLNKNIAPFDMVVGAKGSPLQLVLSSVLHIDTPTGNVKLNEGQFLQNHPFVELAVPVSYGDNYKGFRILGTTIEYLNSYNAQLETGEFFSKDFEVVVGSQVANRLNLDINDEFVGSHGLASAAIEGHDDHPFIVKGILKPTGTTIDQLLITNLESIWEVHDHGHNEADEEHNHNEDMDGHDHNHNKENDEHDHDEENHQNKEDLNQKPDNNKEVTSLLVKFKNPMGLIQLPRFINENTNMQAALPSFEMQRLTNLLGSGVQTINGIALAILLVSGISIFISLLKTIRERRQELALLRTYGLSTKQLFILVLLEGIYLALIGFIFGWIIGRLGLWGISEYMRNEYGYGLEITGPELLEFVLLAITLAIAIFATLLASLSIFKLNVAKTLSDA